MNRDEVKELMPILQAFLDHKELRRKHGMSWVNDHDEIYLDQDYRIKPEPRVFWIYPMENNLWEGSEAEWKTQEFSGVIKVTEDLSDD